jgi:hypothetical protein
MNARGLLRSRTILSRARQTDFTRAQTFDTDRDRRHRDTTASGLSVPWAPADPFPTRGSSPRQHGTVRDLGSYALPPPLPTAPPHRYVSLRLRCVDDDSFDRFHPQRKPLTDLKSCASYWSLKITRVRTQSSVIIITVQRWETIMCSAVVD